MTSDTGAEWQGDVPPPDEPPPTPFERGAVPGAAGVAGAPAAPEAPRRRRGRVLLIATAAVALVAAGALVLDARSGPTGDGAAGPAVDRVADAALLELLEAVDASELVMLGFDERATAAFGDADSEDEALALVRGAAADAVAELVLRRGGLDEPLEVAAAEDVRAAYLPHLDAWIAYLSAVAEDPEVLFGAGTEALTLRINATAGVFVAALEELLAAGAGAEVEAAARAIIDQGFPDQEDADL